MRPLVPLALSLALAIAAPAQQTAFIDDNSPTTGTINTFPWGQANGFTTIHFYTAQQLGAAGICAGAVLTDIAVAPGSGGGANYNAPNARFTVGHAMPVLNPVAWEGNIQVPHVIHDLSQGPYTFPYTVGAWTSLPNVLNAGFQWNGVDDIALFYTSSPGTTGTFGARRTSTNLRYALNIYQATTQTPQSNGNFAMKVRLTFLGGTAFYNSNTPEASLTVSGEGTQPCLPLIRTNNVGTAHSVEIGSSLVGMGWDLIFTTPEGLMPLGGGGQTLPGGEILNIALFAPSTNYLNSLNFPPFPGNFTTPVTSAVPFDIAGQMGIIDPTTFLGLRLSGGIQLGFQ